jgi:7,8-dihydropterin-6-yl-methyl-4-(beta-D-ribofuranosyl)aminobenzene 5'-phosphate synthase
MESKMKMLPSDQLEITTVSENTSGRPGLLGEWGLCVLVEAGEHRFLIDAGASSAVTQNVDALGINLETVEAIVLSHGHFDHTGGLRAILARTRKKPVRIVAHPEVWGLKYSKSRKTKEYRYVGIPFRQEELERVGAQFELTAEPTWLTEDIVVSGEEPMTTAFESVAQNLYVKRGDHFEPDTVIDDQSLYIRTDLGLVIVLGCAHRGMVNIIKHAQQLMDTDRVYMVLGGTHLDPASEEQVTLTIDALKSVDLRWLGVSHCTGQKVAARLSQSFGDKFFYNNTGRVLRFPFEQ